MKRAIEPAKTYDWPSVGLFQRYSRQYTHSRTSYVIGICDGRPLYDNLSRLRAKYVQSDIQV